MLLTQARFSRTRKFFEGDGQNGGQQKTFTQEELNAIVQERLKKASEATEAERKKNQELLASLEQTKQALTEGSAQRTQLEKQMEDLKNRAFTAEELSSQAVEQARKESEQALKTALDSASYWKQTHQQAIVQQTVQQALVQGGVKPHLLPVATAYLQQQLSVEEATGRDGRISFVIQAKVPVLKENKTETMVMTPAQLVEHWRTSGTNPELFTPRAASGAGAAGSGFTGSVTPDDVAAQIMQRKN